MKSLNNAFPAPLSYYRVFVSAGLGIRVNNLTYHPIIIIINSLDAEGEEEPT